MTTTDDICATGLSPRTHPVGPGARGSLVLVAVGTRGDVQPYVALGRGLRAAGYRVTIATHDNFSTLVLAHGLQYARICGDPRDVLATTAGNEALRSRDRFQFLRRTMQLMADYLEQGVRDCLAAAHDADALLVSPVALAIAHPVAEALRIPLIRCFLAPATATGTAPAFALPGGLRLGPAANRLTYTVSRQLLWTLARPAVNSRCRPQLGLPPLPLRDPMRALDDGKTPFLYGYSPAVLPRPRDWPHSVRVTGYWFLDRPHGWQPEPELARFLADGEPPVCIGFSSTTSNNAAATIAMVDAALQRAGRRGVLLTGWLDPELRAGGPQLSRHLYVTDDVPHDWIFPRCAGVVCHAGAGTVGAAMRAGVPVLATPFHPEQQMWADSLHKLGVSPAPIPQRSLSVDNLAAGLTAITTDPELQSRAHIVGSRVRAEDGVTQAVTELQPFLDQVCRVQGVQGVQGVQQQLSEIA
jgi:UDP:flavonoid glycosyltransferase YjiC (YdhE family)